MQLGFACSDRSVLPTTLSLSRPFAALGRGGRPRAARAKPEAAKAATAAAAEDKKPPTAYALFVKEQFPAVKASAPTAGFSEIAKTVSTQWKSLSETDKSKYQAVYTKAKAEWDKKHAPAVAPKKSKKEPKPVTPKKPPSAYALYVKQNFHSYAKPGQSAPDTMRVLSGAWKQLTDAEKAKYKAT